MSSGQLFYYVACRRTDSRQPGLEKAMRDKIFLTPEDAELLADEVRERLDMDEEIEVFGAVAYAYKVKK